MNNNEKSITSATTSVNTAKPDTKIDTKDYIQVEFVPHFGSALRISSPRCVPLQSVGTYLAATKDISAANGQESWGVILVKGYSEKTFKTQKEAEDFIRQELGILSIKGQ